MANLGMGRQSIELDDSAYSGVALSKRIGDYGAKRGDLLGKARIGIAIATHRKF